MQLKWLDVQNFPVHYFIVDYWATFAFSEKATWMMNYYKLNKQSNKGYTVTLELLYRTVTSEHPNYDSGNKKRPWVPLQ